MQFNVSRQSLLPATVTLIALAVVAVVAMRSTPVAGAAGADRALVVDLPGIMLTQFQNGWPRWSQAIVGLLIIVSGMYVGRITTRYTLYAVSTCIAIPLYALVACILPSDGSLLNGFTASLLLALSLKNYTASFCNGYSFDGMFRASICLGVLVFVLPAALPLLLLLPFAVILFRRTLREAMTAAVGVVLPALTLCYVNWAVGGSFVAPVVELTRLSVLGSPLDLFLQLSAPAIGSFALIGLLLLFAIVLFLSNIYVVGTKARFIITYNIGMLLICGSMLFGPAATCDLFALFAIPAAILLPILFVRLHRAFALAIYLLLLISFCVSIALQ